MVICLTMLPPKPRIGYGMYLIIYGNTVRIIMIVAALRIVERWPNGGRTEWRPRCGLFSWRRHIFVAGLYLMILVYSDPGYAHPYRRGHERYWRIRLCGIPRTSSWYTTNAQQQYPMWTMLMLLRLLVLRTMYSSVQSRLLQYLWVQLMRSMLWLLLLLAIAVVCRCCCCSSVRRICIDILFNT